MRPIICDDCLWNFESTYNVFLDELGDIFVFDTGISFCLHPLIEVVGCNKQKLFFVLLQWTRGRLCPSPITKMAKDSLTLIASYDIVFNFPLFGGSIVSMHVGTVVPKFVCLGDCRICPHGVWLGHT